MNSTGNIFASESKRWHILLGLTLCVLLITGCTVVASPTEADLVLTAQPTSPLIPGKSAGLVENRWRLAQVLWQGQQLDWEQIGPVFISFDMQGLMGISAVNCNAASFIIVAEDERHFRLVPAESTLVSCGKLGDQQEKNLHDAVRATIEYELQGNQLLLSGKDVRVVAEIEAPSP